MLGHEGKCRFLHGHRGVAEVTVQGPRLDSVGRIVDFGVIKELVGGWIDQHWDHNLLLNASDPQREHLFNTEERSPYLMAYGNPTAENMARALFNVAKELLHHSLVVTKVRIWETPSCYADYTDGT